MALETLRYDDDAPESTTVTRQTWEIAGVAIKEANVLEAVRFELPHPAKIHQISVQYGDVPPYRNFEMTLGLYGDFGYNGFDLWRDDPLWRGARCSGDVRPGEWVTFTLPEPVVVEHPGLVYVANHREYPDDPALLFDLSPPEPCANPNNCCEAFSACPSAWTFPDLTNLDGTPFWKGLATSFQYDYRVRLTVEYTERVAPDERLFERVETPPLGSRFAWGDFDDDGDDDLISNGALYRNDSTPGAVALVDVTAGSGLEGAPGSGGVWGDYDNDGCLDLLMFAESTTQSDALMRGDCAGHFTDVTSYAGISDLLSEQRCSGDPAQDRAPTAAAAWADVDADGHLDLWLGNFFCWADGSAYHNQLWRSRGDGTFEEWSATRGLEMSTDERLATRDVTAVDLDQDGDVDLFEGNYRLHRNRLYENLGGGSFEEVGEARGVAGHPRGRRGAYTYGHTIGVAWGDLDGDARLDLVVGNLAHPRFFDFSNKSQVLMQRADGRFEDIQGEFARPVGAAGLRYQETHSVPVLGDFDADGALDLALSAVYDGRPTDFYWGRGDGTFTLDAYHAGIDTKNGWGMAAADVDGDGALDIATNGGLYRNARALPSHPRGAWLALRLVGDVASNRAAIGATATVVLEEGGLVRRVVRSVSGGGGQGGQPALTLHYGLGDAERVAAIVVRFIGGALVTYEGPFEVNQRLRLAESGSVTRE